MKRIVSWEELGKHIESLQNQLKIKKTKFEQIIAIGRGGLPIAPSISHRFNIPIEVVDVSSYNENTNKQDHFRSNITIRDIENRWYDNILIVDDLVDNGTTIKYLLDLIEQSKRDIKSIIATIFYKERSIVKPDCYSERIGDSWIVFPWEV